MIRFECKEYLMELITFANFEGPNSGINLTLYKPSFMQHIALLSRDQSYFNL